MFKCLVCCQAVDEHLHFALVPMAVLSSLALLIHFSTTKSVSELFHGDADVIYKDSKFVGQPRLFNAGFL